MSGMVERVAMAWSKLSRHDRKARPSIEGAKHGTVDGAGKLSGSPFCGRGRISA